MTSRGNYFNDFPEIVPTREITAKTEKIFLFVVRDRGPISWMFEKSTYFLEWAYTAAASIAPALIRRIHRSEYRRVWWLSEKWRYLNKFLLFWLPTCWDISCSAACLHFTFGGSRARAPTPRELRSYATDCIFMIACRPLAIKARLHLFVFRLIERVTLLHARWSYGSTVLNATETRWRDG